MANKSFSKKEAVKYGWNTTRKNFKFFLVVLLILFAVNVIPGVITPFTQDSQLITFVVSLGGWVLQMAVSLGAIFVALKIHDKKKTTYSDLFQHFRLIIPYLFASILYGLIVLGGFILLVVPGIVWSVKFRYFTYFMVDQNMGPIDALKASAKITKNQKMNLFLFGLLLGLINILGMLALLVGLLWTIPTAMMAEAWVFRKLSSK